MPAKLNPTPGRTYWTYAAEDCDVSDKDALRTYRRKFAEWVDWLSGDDDHAILQQIWLMSRNYVAFRVINESRRIADAQALNSAIRNTEFFSFLTTGFLATQALAIRRLTEEESKDLRREVISLRRLVDDIHEHQSLVTRELFVCIDGCPFDPRPGHDRDWERMRQKTDANGGTYSEYLDYPTAGPEAWHQAEQRHAVFDRLSVICSRDRKRSDRISERVLSALRTSMQVDAVEKARTLANKRVAHAASATSRARAKQSTSGISLREIDAAHKSLISATGFVSSELLYQGNLGAVPTPQYDVLEFVSESGFDEAAIVRLRRTADVHAERRSKWARDGRYIVSKISQEARTLRVKRPR